jgi:asparagine synthase (glutamine-hydrolysing)
MCGIAGWIGRIEYAPGVAQRLAEALRHRGPDAFGVRLFDQAALVHTRLSILDLSPAGAQPMGNEDGTVWVAFNGEIYNHHEIRQWLETKGHRFRGHSDTEILPHLYEEEGADFVHRLRGMFAFAVYDARKGTLLLARDRFGIKPLFYTLEPGRLAFASEINALRQVPDVDFGIDRQAVYDYASMLCIPAPLTLYRGVAALEPGQVLEARMNGPEVSRGVKRYHQFRIVEDDGVQPSAEVERGEELIAQAVKSQLESDVPLGCLLSGGIDSSLVSAAAQKAISSRLHTYNVKFPDPEYDETWAAQAVARHIGSEHQTLDMPASGGGWEEITSLLRQCGQPFADTSLFAVHAVCREMRKQVTVALSGDGGDEAFGGYNAHWNSLRVARWQLAPSPLLRLGAGVLDIPAALGWIPRRYPERLRMFCDRDDVATAMSLLSWLSDQEHSDLCRDQNMLPVRRHFEPKWENIQPKGHSRAKRLFSLVTEANVRLILPSDFLAKVDTASMKVALEVRVPMLDEDLFDFGLSLPLSYKVKGRNCKLLLRQIAQRQLPAEVSRKKKMGFGIPVDRWVTEDFRHRLREAVLGPGSDLPEYFDPAVYSPWVRSFLEQTPHPTLSRGNVYQRVIMLLALQLFLRPSLV